MTTSPLHPRHIDDRSFGTWAAASGSTGARVMLAIAVAADCAIFTFGSRWFGMPALTGFDGSITNQANPIAACLTIAVLILVAGLVGTVVAGSVRFEAGLFAAACGLAAISQRCGTMQTVLLESGGNASVYGQVIVDVIIYSAFLIGLWGLLWLMGRMKLVDGHQAVEAGESSTSESSLVGRLTALAVQIVATGILLMFLCQSEAKNQALASVGIASFLATLIAYKYSPVRPSIWYWLGPLIVGVIGYSLAAAGQDANLAIGSPTGTFAALVRPLPIDYASLGTAGAILGYWTMRKK